MASNNLWWMRRWCIFFSFSFSLSLRESKWSGRLGNCLPGGTPSMWYNSSTFRCKKAGPIQDPCQSIIDVSDMGMLGETFPSSEVQMKIFEPCKPGCHKTGLFCSWRGGMRKGMRVAYRDSKLMWSSWLPWPGSTGLDHQGYSVYQSEQSIHFL